MVGPSASRLGGVCVVHVAAGRARTMMVTERGEMFQVRTGSARTWWALVVSWSFALVEPWLSPG